MAAAITLDGFDFETPPASPALELEGFDFAAPTPAAVSVAPSITVPPIDASRAQRRQRVREFNAIPTALDNAASSSEFGRGLSRGVLQVGSGFAGFGEIFADLVGADTAKAWLKGKGDYLTELSAAIPSAVENFTQIRDLTSLGAYTASAIGELVPQIALSFGAGGLAARGATTAGSALLRGTAAAGATSYTQEAGGMYRGIRDETGQEAPLTALAFGVPAAALDVLTPARFLGKVFDGASDELKSKAWTALVKRSFVEAAKAAPIEGLTEGLQESIAISASKFADSTYDAINGKNFIRVLDAGLRGVIGGGVIGATVPFVEGRGRQETGGIDDTPPRIVSAEIPPQPPPPYAPTPIPQQPGAVTQPARDVSVVQAQGTPQRPDVLNRGLLLGPTQSTPQASQVGAVVPFNAGQLGSINPQDLQDALEHYGEKGAGFSKRHGKTTGWTISLRQYSGLKPWEDMTPAERLDEFRASALNDLRVAVTEAENPVEYMLDRALDRLDPMAGLYKAMLKMGGAVITGGRIKLSPEQMQALGTVALPSQESPQAPPVTPPVAPPVPVPVAEPTPPPPPPTGPRWQAQTPAGEATVSGVWRVSSARDLVTSFDSGYDSTLQPRDRSRLASREQIATIASNLDVNRVGESPTTNLGAPIGNAASRVLSGNGRVAAFRMIYDAAGRTADELRSFVRQRAGELGLNADEVAAIPDPVLWREVVDYGGLDPVQFSIISNQSDVMGMSPGEKAVSDTRMLERDPALLDMFLPSEDGDVLAASNREFLNRFIQATGDQATLMSAEGYNGPVLTKRVKNAMAGLLIGAEDSTLMRDLLEESEATGIKRVADAVIASVPLMMRLRGTRYDLGPAIAQALRDLLRIKKGNEKIYDFLGHRSLFGDPLRTALSDMMLGIMHQAKSIKALVGVLQRYHALARKTLDDLAGIAPPNPAPTREQILQAANETTTQNQRPAVQEGFTFGQPPPAVGQSPGPVAPGAAPESGGTQGPLASMGPESAPTFYSRLQRTVEESKQQKASGAQWKATIRQSKLGANADEWALVGVDSLEDAKPYTKAEVLGFLRDNEIQVREVTLSSGRVEEIRERSPYQIWKEEQERATAGIQSPPGNFSESFYNSLPHNYRVRYEIMSSETTRQHARTFDDTHFSQYQLGGGEPGTYREWVLHLRDKSFGSRAYQEQLQEEFNQKYGTDWSGENLSKEDSDRWKASGNAIRKAMLNWRDGHVPYNDIRNPVVRLRGAIHTTTDGKRMLLIEELQAPTPDNFEKMPALFQAKWRDIGFKFALRKAAELGVDLVGWTTGAQQAARYSLSHQVDKIAWSRGGYRDDPNEDGFLIQGFKDGNRIVEKSGIPGRELEGVIGKELASRIIQESANRPSGSVEGVDLDVGGAGLAKLYDVDFRNVVNSLPSVKKAGVKVGTAEIATERNTPYRVERMVDGNWITHDSYANERDAGYTIATLRSLSPDGEFRIVPEGKSTNIETVHALPITPEMRASVLQGQPLASVGQRGQIRGIPVERVKADIAPLAARFGVNVEVLKTPPADLGPQFANARGMVYLDGRAQLFADNIPPGTDPNELFFHEVAVHLGLEVAAKTPEQKKELASILGSVATRLMPKADEIARRDGFADFADLAKQYGYDMATPDGRLRGIAELLGREAQRYAAMKTPPSWWRQLIGKLKAWLGRIFRFDIGDDGVYAIITKGLSRAGQAQRAAVGATTQPPLASLGPTLTEKQLRDTIAFTPDPATQQTEAVMASGQVTGLLGVLRDYIVSLANQFIPAGLSAAEQQRRTQRAAFIADITRLEGVENLAQQLGVTPQQFDAAYNAMPDAGMKTLIAKHWFDQFNIFERNARRTTAKRVEAAAKVASPGFQQKLRNLRVQFNRKDMAEQARLLIVAQLKNGLDQARARIGQQGINEAMFATANEQIRLFTELLQRVDPIQRRIQDIIRTANNNLALFTGIVDGTFATPEDLLNAYMAANPALPGPGPEMVELRVAADILHRTRDLALRMTAAEASEDAAVNQAVTDLEGRIRHSVDAGNFRMVVHNVLRKVVSYASKEGKAAAIVNITQKPLLRQIETLEALEFGEAVFNATLADPRYRTMRNRANELVGAFPRPAHAITEKGEPVTPISSPFLPEHTVYLPDGTTAVFKMSSKKSDWDAQRQSIDDALANLTAYLAANPATDPARDPYRSFYQWEFDTLNTLWHASFAFDSPKMFPAFRNFHFKMVDSMLKMFDGLADQIGTRDINLAKSLAGILKDVMHQMSDWSSKNSQNITHMMYLAIRSHPEITNGNALDAAGRQWFREVLNPIFASLRNPGKPGYRTGDIIASSGRKVTRQDMDAARRQAKSTADAMAINVAQDRLNYATPPLVEDRIIPGAPALRRVLTLSPMMVPRRFGRDGRDVAAQFIERVIQGGMTPQVFWRDLNRWHHVKSMVEDRGEEYSTVSPLQLEDAFRAAKAELQTDPSPIDDIQSLAAFMAQHTTATVDEIEAFIDSEMTKAANAFINAIPDLQQQKKGGPVPEFDIKAWEQANAFTLGRGKALAPPSFYEYGFKDTAGILNFATSGNSFYMDQFVQSLREIAARMRRYRDTTIKERTDELIRTMGETRGTEQVRAENRENIRLGNETLLWEKVDDYANSLDGFVRTFNENYTVGGKETETQVRSADNWLSRLVGGILSGMVGTTRNAIDGGFYHNGVRLSRLESSTLRAFPRAAYHVLKTTIPLGLRAIPATIKGGFTALGKLPSAAMTLARTGNFLKFEGELFGKAIDDISDSLFGSKEISQQLKNRGLAMHVTPSETVENIAVFWQSSGVNREVQMSGNPFARFFQTAFQFIGSAVDVQLALFAKPFFPRVGDLIANEAVAGATLGALKNFEKRFRILADTFRQLGITGATLANRQFTAKEVFGAFPGMGTTAEDLRLLEQWFVESNVDFHRSLANWFKRLETDPAAQWLTHEEKWRLAIRSVEVINAATPFNRPLALRDNFLTRMIGLVLGWNIHAYRQQAAYIGQSADNQNSQFKIRAAIALWMLVILAAADASNEGTELLVRMITRLMGDPERSTRLPHEMETTSDQLKSHIVYAFNSVPFVANVVNAALNDQPTKAGFSPYLLIQNKVVDIINWVGGVINSGDITYRTPQLLKGFVPLPGLAVALNQLPEIAGQKPAVDTTRLYTRYGEKELLAKPFIRSGPGASANVTPLTPYGDRLIAAVISGDTEKADRLYTEAIQIATRLGKRDPEQSVRGMLLSRLPISRAFKTTPTPQQYSALLGRMSDSQRARVNDFNQRATIGLARLGIETNKIYPLATARNTGTSTRGRTARNRLYRAPRIRRVRLGGSRSRSRLGTRRRRNSLVRASAA